MPLPRRSFLTGLLALPAVVLPKKAEADKLSPLANTLDEWVEPIPLSRINDLSRAILVEHFKSGKNEWTIPYFGPFSKT